MAPFIIFSLPRSRSAWLSVFLSAPGRIVGHDIGTECARPADFFAKLGPGTCETGAGFAWRYIRRERPDIRFIVVRRDPEAVIASLDNHGLFGFRDEIMKRDGELDAISCLPGTLTVAFEDLAYMDGCAKVYRACIDRNLDPVWWKHMDLLNIQVDLPRQMAKTMANWEGISNLKLACSNA